MTRFLQWPIIVFYLLFHFDAWAKVFIDYRHIWPEAPSERVLNSFPTGHFYTFISLMEAQHFSKFGGQQRRISMEDFFHLRMMESKKEFSRTSTLVHPFQKIYNYKGLLRQHIHFISDHLKFAQKKGLIYVDQEPPIKGEGNNLDNWRQAISKYEQIWHHVKKKESEEPRGKSWFYYNKRRREYKKIYSDQGPTFFEEQESAYSNKKQRKALKPLAKSLKHKHVSFFQIDYEYKFELLIKYLTCHVLSAQMKRTQKNVTEINDAFEGGDGLNQNILIVGYDPWQSKVMVRTQHKGVVYLPVKALLDEMESIDFLYQKRKKTKNCTREENQFGIVISQDEQREP